MNERYKDWEDGFMRSSLNTQILRWIFCSIYSFFFKLSNLMDFFVENFQMKEGKIQQKTNKIEKMQQKLKKNFQIFLVFVWESGKWRDSLEKDLTKKFEWNSKVD